MTRPYDGRPNEAQQICGEWPARARWSGLPDPVLSLPCVLSAAVTARLQRDPRVWDWVISVRDGAGVAAQMVSRGQARFAVLMDPVSGIPDLPGVLDAMMAKARASGPPDFGPMSEALSLWTDVHAR